MSCGSHSPSSIMWLTPTYPPGCHFKNLFFRKHSLASDLLSHFPPCQPQERLVYKPSSSGLSEYAGPTWTPDNWNSAYLWLFPPRKLWSQGLGLCSFLFASPGPDIVLGIHVGSQSINTPWIALLQVGYHWLGLKHFHKSAILPLKFDSTSPIITQQSDSLTTQSTAA